MVPAAAAWAASPGAGLRSIVTSVRPGRSSCSAIASPMPREAPVRITSSVISHALFEAGFDKGIEVTVEHA